MQPMLTMALRAANLAADIIAKAADRLDLVDVQAKGLNDYVTQVDQAAERAIIEFEGAWFTLDEDRHDAIRARFACSVAT